MNNMTKALLIEQHGTAYFDSPIVLDTQEFTHDLVFSWDEECKHIEEIRIINIHQNLMVDANKEYRVVLQEIKKIDI